MVLAGLRCQHRRVLASIDVMKENIDSCENSIARTPSTAAVVAYSRSAALQEVYIIGVLNTGISNKHDLSREATSKPEVTTFW